MSLIEIVEGPDGEPMIWLLETIRRFAREQLTAAGEDDDVRLSHARWCVEVATQISAVLHGPRAMSALDRMDAVEEDIRAALDWSLAPTNNAADERHECGYALLGKMDTYWYRFGYIAEGRGWHDRALAVLSAEDVADSGRVVDALHGQGIMAVQQLDLTTGTAALERALAMAHRLGDLDREARESNSLGIARREAGDVEHAQVLIERSLSLARRIGNPHREATALTNVVHMHMDVGDYEAAVAAARRAVAADTALNDTWGVAINQANLVVALLNAEGPRQAYQLLVEVAEDTVALGDLELTIDVVESCAAISAALGQAAKAARLLGAADQQREVAGLPRAAPDQRHLDRFVEPARQSIPQDVWQRAQRSGRRLSAEAAVAEGIADRSTIEAEVVLNLDA